MVLSVAKWVANDQPSKAFDLATTLSTVKPNFSINFFPGAEAPNVVMPFF